MRAGSEDKGLSTRELIAQELDRLPEADLKVLLSFVQSFRDHQADSALPALAAESSLGKDWLTPEEDAAWADL